MWLGWIFEHVKNISNELMAIALWALWYARNKYVFEGIYQSIHDLFTFIRAYYDEFRVVSAIVGHPNPQLEVRWSPSVHWDKVLSQRFISCRFGFVARAGNRAAHIMASEGPLRVTDEFWVEDAPLHII
ncbi:hypothetical protein V6N12_063311 [Hibiscus sabdariffa]|uniref:RNase H type-1 domain-containing protein n=1 Tax=Hibiscus sabdariffa TaxID=183260 RepID=A0ABR2FBG6_9ROSI